jgi:hypothetical protein
MQYDMAAVKCDECIRLAEMHCLHDLNQNNVGNLNSVRCEASRHFRNKKKECLIDELEINSKLKKKSENCVATSLTLRRVTSLELT